MHGKPLVKKTIVEMTRSIGIAQAVIVQRMMKIGLPILAACMLQLVIMILM